MPIGDPRYGYGDVTNTNPWMDVDMLTTDPTEDIRRQQCQAIANDLNAAKAQGVTHEEIKLAIEALHGQTWDTAQMQTDFEAIGFMAPLIVVRRRSDGQKGSLYFTHGYNPRLYYGFEEDK